MNPFAGTWIANLDESRRHANHQLHNATLTFEISDDDGTLGLQAQGIFDRGGN